MADEVVLSIVNLQEYRAILREELGKGNLKGIQLLHLQLKLQLHIFQMIIHQAIELTAAEPWEIFNL
jgi:hypothetical protein